MTDPIIDRLDQIKGRADKATEGPWEHYGDGDHEVYQAVEYDDGDLGGYITWSVPARADAEFIAHARTDVEQMEAALRAVLDLHILDDEFPNDPVKKCVACNLSDREGLDPTPWPCPTVRAIADALGVETEGGEK